MHDPGAPNSRDPRPERDWADEVFDDLCTPMTPLPNPVGMVLFVRGPWGGPRTAFREKLGLFGVDEPPPGWTEYRFYTAGRPVMVAHHPADVEWIDGPVDRTLRGPG